MTIQDCINGSYEAIGGAFLLINCLRLYKDKEVKGITLSAAFFFSTWSWWNLYYYPHLNQWMSFYGALLIAASNTLWIAMAIYYTYFKKSNI
jgi:uncharacterized membrane protein YfcA